MTFELPLLFGLTISYLLGLFILAWLTDKDWIPERIARHPVTYTLSLGVYASSWTYYGSVGFAQSNGFAFLTIYLGVTLAFILSPVLLKPILRITSEQQLTSLADLFAFRYRCKTAGILVSIFMLIGTVPYLALQIQAVTASIQTLTDETTPEFLALLFCLILIVFSILFGAGHARPREKNKGLVVAIAFESIIKLIALLLVSGFALFGIFDGPAALNQWLNQNPESLQHLYQPVQDQSWQTLIFLSFAAAFLLPRQFQMIFTENNNPQALKTASWLFPAFLLLLNLGIPLILWAGEYLEIQGNADQFVLGITLQSQNAALSILVFLGGVSAASAMLIVSAIALANMSLNHLLLPGILKHAHDHLHEAVIIGRRILIALIILAGFGFYLLFQHQQGLVELGLISFVAVAQFLPGIFGVIFWPKANRRALIAGLSAGIAIWFITLLLPLLQKLGIFDSLINISVLISQSGMDQWTFATLLSLTLNGLFFVMISFIQQPSAAEKQAALQCCCFNESTASPVIVPDNLDTFEYKLAHAIGQSSSKKEIQQAMLDLGMQKIDSAQQLQKLMQQVEKNLSGLIGPSLAHALVFKPFELNENAAQVLGDSVQFIENRLAHSERLASIGQLAAGVAHEIGNPLAGIASISQNLRDTNQDRQTTEAIDAILLQSERIKNIIQSLMNFSRDANPNDRFEASHLCDLIHEAVSLVRLSRKHSQVHLEVICSADRPITVNRQTLTQALINILTNAVDASPAHQQVEILARQETSQTIIEIMDHGSGIDPAIRERLFEPFVTTKPTGQGTGLGLALAHRFISAHNGILEIDSQSGVGTRVVISLPHSEVP